MDLLSDFSSHGAAFVKVTPFPLSYLCLSRTCSQGLFNVKNSVARFMGFELHDQLQLYLTFSLLTLLCSSVMPMQVKFEVYNSTCIPMRSGLGNL